MEDESLGFLNTIFDFSGAMDTITGDGSMVAGAIAQMFGIYNSFAMVAVALIMLYIWSVAVMHTAWEGQALGERYSTLWTPMRSVMSIVFVAPFPGLGGLSILQGIIISLVALSIQGANQLYQVELEFFQDNNGSLMPLGSETDTPDRNLINAAITGSACLNYMSENATAGISAPGIGPGSVYARNVRQSGGDLLISYGNQISGRNVCGAIHVDCKNQIDYGDASAPHEAICRAKQAAVKAFTARTGPIVDSLLAEGAKPALPAVAASIQAAVDAYRSAWTNQVAANPNITETDAGVYMIALTAEQENEVKSFTDKAGAEGWLTAGKWYWLLSSYSLEQQNLSKANTSVQQLDEDGVVNYAEGFAPELQRVKSYLAEANVELGRVGNATPLLSTTEADGDEQKASAVVSEIWSDSWGMGLHTWTEALKGENDPIRTLAGYGQYMITGGWSMIGAVAILKAGSAMDSSVWGQVASAFTGSASSAIAGVASFIGSVMTVVAAWLIGTGGLLAYYVPVIPYVFWVLAVLGWAVMFFGSMLAAPLWAASHSVPEGEGFAGRYALQGWQLMVNVVMRPILMVIGLLVSMFLMHAIVSFALDGYAIFNQTVVNSTSSAAITGFLFTNFIMTILVIILTHKAHELIYDIGDEVMKYIGFGVTPLGSVKSEGEVKGMAKGTSAGTERIVGAGLGKLAGEGGGTRRLAGPGGGESSGGRPMVSGSGEASQRDDQDAPR